MLFFSLAYAAPETGQFSVLVSAGNKNTLTISGFLPDSIKGEQYNLEVFAYDGIRIADKFVADFQSIPIFNVNVESRYSYGFRMYAYDKKFNRIAVSEDVTGIFPSNFSNGVQSDGNRNPAKSLAANTINGNLTALVDKVGCSSFPYIDMSVQVAKNGQVVKDLTNNDKSNGNFIVLESGLSPSDNIKIIPPQSDTLKRTADFAFVFDHSGSMDDNLSQLRNSIGSFVDALKVSNIDYNLAFIPYERSAIIKQDMTSDPQIFLNSVDDFLAHWPSGGTENAFKALQTTVSSLAWRPNTQKVIVIFTDEDDDNGGPTLSIINQTLKNAGATVYGVVSQGFGHANYDFCAAGSVTSSTGGRCYNIYSPSYNDILNDITKTVGDSYLIRYKSSNLNSSSGSRLINLTVNDGTESVVASASYDPYQCAGLTISLAAEDTLLGKKHRDYQPVPISVYANSADPSLAVTTTLYYRKVGQTSYASVPMGKINTGSYQGSIPAAIPAIHR